MIATKSPHVLFLRWFRKAGRSRSEAGGLIMWNWELRRSYSAVLYSIGSPRWRMTGFVDSLDVREAVVALDVGISAAGMMDVWQV